LVKEDKCACREKDLLSKVNEIYYRRIKKGFIIPTIYKITQIKNIKDEIKNAKPG
jgi:hypothetical protein